jgi:hypothetical protein
MKKSIILFYLLISGCSLYPQDLALKTAEQYFAINNYESAITEYKRYIFFNAKKDDIGDVYYKMALTYRDQGKLDEAINAIEASIFYTDLDSIREERIITKAIISFVHCDSSQAIFSLLKLTHFSNYKRIRQESSFYLGLYYLKKCKWNESYIAFHNCFQDLPKIQMKLDSLFLLTQKITYRSPKLAKWLSTFLPGSGQIYGGDYRDGANAFIINTALGVIFVDSILNKHFQDSFLINLTFLERYYRGNYHNAEEIVKSYNSRICQPFIVLILDYMRLLSIKYPEIIQS